MSPTQTACPTPSTSRFTSLMVSPGCTTARRKDVYKLLIDTFRLRLDDDYKFSAINTEGSVYAGERNSLSAFERFLRLAERQPGLLPSWWSSEKMEECIATGMAGNATTNWCSLEAGPEKSDMIEHYSDPQIPMQMRMFGEQVYGNGPGGQDGAAMLRMMMTMEGKSGDDDGMVTSLFGISSRSGRPS